MDKKQAKVSKVMREFKEGKLKSSSGQKVKNPKQAIAIGLSEAGLSRKKEGGMMKESKGMIKKEIGFMKKAGAPKSMIKHEMAEAKGMKKGGYASGGMTATKATNIMQQRLPNLDLRKQMTAARSVQPMAYPKATKNATTGMTTTKATAPLKKMKSGGMSACKTVAKKEVKSHEKRMHGMKAGGLSAGHKQADGIAKKGKTKAAQIKMRKGGYC